MRLSHDVHDTAERLNSAMRAAQGLRIGKRCRPPAFAAVILLAPVATLNKFHLKYIFGPRHDLRIEEFQAVVRKFGKHELPKLELNPERCAPRARNLDDL